MSKAGSEIASLPSLVSSHCTPKRIFSMRWRQDTDVLHRCDDLCKPTLGSSLFWKSKRRHHDDAWRLGRCCRVQAAGRHDRWFSYRMNRVPECPRDAAGRAKAKACRRAGARVIVARCTACRAKQKPVHSGLDGVFDIVNHRKRIRVGIQACHVCLFIARHLVEKLCEGCNVFRPETRADECIRQDSQTMRNRSTSLLLSPAPAPRSRRLSRAGICCKSAMRKGLTKQRRRRMKTSTSCTSSTRKGS